MNAVIAAQAGVQRSTCHINTTHVAVRDILAGLIGDETDTKGR